MEDISTHLLIFSKAINANAIFQCEHKIHLAFNHIDIYVLSGLTIMPCLRCSLQKSMSTHENGLNEWTEKWKKEETKIEENTRLMNVLKCTHKKSHTHTHNNGNSSIGNNYELQHCSSLEWQSSELRLS